MSRTSKSPRRIAAAALALGRRVLPAYSHPNAPKTFTQPQLLACLVLKRFLKTDDRGVAALLEDCACLRRVIGLKKTPHHTTLFKAQARLLRFGVVRRLLAASGDALGRSGRIERVAAADSTGFESSRVSPYFVWRRQGHANQPQRVTYTRYPKLHVLTDVKTHLILAAYPKRGPTPDVGELRRLMRGLPRRLRPAILLADAGYDSAANHHLIWKTLQAAAIIPATIGRKTTKPATNSYRRLMQELFEHVGPKAIGYGQRWQAETVMSMLKRNLGHAVSSRRYHHQNRDLLLHCITHNAMILNHQ